jgi:hypothetical protein
VAHAALAYSQRNLKETQTAGHEGGGEHIYIYGKIDKKERKIDR